MRRDFVGGSVLIACLLLSFASCDSRLTVDLLSIGVTPGNVLAVLPIAALIGCQ